jgi:hypothetical protein
VSNGYRESGKLTLLKNQSNEPTKVKRWPGRPLKRLLDDMTAKFMMEYDDDYESKTFQICHSFHVSWDIYHMDLSKKICFFLCKPVPRQATRQYLWCIAICRDGVKAKTGKKSEFLWS